MVTLQETAVKFNNNLHASHTGGRLSSDFGLLLVDELMDAFHFEDLIKQLIIPSDLRHLIYQKFNAQGVSFSFPRQDVFIMENEKTNDK